MKRYFDLRSLIKGIWYKTIQFNLPGIPFYVDAKMNYAFGCGVKTARETFLQTISYI